MKQFTLFLLMFIPCFLYAQDSEDDSPDIYYYNGLYYDIISENDMTVEVNNLSSGLYGEYNDNTIVIPSEISLGLGWREKQYTVTKIGKCAFRDCKELTQVILPNTITEIDNFAFYGCSSLISCNFESMENLKRIGVEAFAQTDLNGELTIPSSVEYIDTYAFSYSNITSINRLFLGSMGHLGLTMGRNAFFGCKKLEKVSLDVMNIYFEGNPFPDCPKLSKIDYAHPSFISSTEYACVDDGCIYMGVRDNIGPERLKLICCPSGATEFKPASGLKTIGLAAFGYCPKITRLEIPDGVEEIEMGGIILASEPNDKTKREIIIPQSVTKMEEEPFLWYNDNLCIYNYSSTPQPAQYMWERHNIGELHVPYGSKKLYEQNSYWAQYRIIEDINAPIFDGVYATVSDLTVCYKLDKIPTITYEDDAAILKLGDAEHAILKLPLKKGAVLDITFGSYDKNKTIIPVKITETGYATLYSPTEIIVPSGIEVYVPIYDENTNTLKVNNSTRLSAGIVLPVCTGVILKGNRGAYSLNVSTTTPTKVNTCLDGTAICIPTSSITDDVYVLSRNNNITGFYKYKGDELSARKAYLALPNGTEAKSVGLNFEDQITTINNVVTNNNQQTIYTIDGQKVNKMNAHGIYIINGKKIVK